MTRFQLRAGAVALAAACSCGGDSTPSDPGRPQPPPSWTRQIGTASNEDGTALARDATGNLFVAGVTMGSLGGTSAGRQDAFVTKLSAAGATAWTRQLGTSADDAARGAAAGPAGDVYVAGWTGGALDGNASAGARDAFLVKYDPEGAKQWTRQLGTADDDEAAGVAVDASGDVYVAGFTSGALDGNPSAGGRDVFVVKYDATGAKQWTVQVGSPSDDYASSVALGPTGDVHVSGYTLGAIGAAAAGGFDAFVLKLDPAGATRWARQLGGEAQDWGTSVAVDPEGNVFLGGSTEDALEGAASNRCIDTFVVKYDAGGAKLWTRQFGTPADAGCQDDVARAVAADASGDVLVVGYTSGSVDGIARAGAFDLFVAKYDALGAVQWSTQLGSAGLDAANAVTTDGVGSAFVAGSTGGRLGAAASAGGMDAFVVMYHPASMTR